MKKKLLFVGASGTVAEILIPYLTSEYDIVGISANRDHLSKHCTEFVKTDLLHEKETFFPYLFKKHTFDAVVWNAVRYFQTPLLNTSRTSIHTEFDIAVALPLLCAQAYLKSTEPVDKKLILLSSQSAFGYKAGLATYSIVKRAEIMLAEYLAIEHTNLQCYALTPGGIPKTKPETICAAVHTALKNQIQQEVVVRIEQDKI